MSSQKSSSPSSSLSLATTSTIKQSLLSPYITGPLLLYATLYPSVLSKVPWFPAEKKLPLPFRIPFTTRDSVTLRADPPLKVLKVLFGIGVVIHLNRFLNRLALNYWHVRKQGVPWSFDVEGAETIVVTGGCSGFGKEMVQMFADQTKANIVVLDIQELPDDLKMLPRVTCHKIDLSSPSSITTTISSLLDDHDMTPPTVLINNAGIAQAHTILGTSDAYLSRIFQINVLSHFTLLRLLLPVMLRRRKGHVVTLASGASYIGVANLADYSATKAAVLGMHESLVQELAHHRYGPDGHCIQASIVHPTWARTPLIGSWEPELSRSKQFVLTPRDVASKVVAQVLSGRSGSVFVPDKVWQATLVRAVPDWVAMLFRSGLESATNTK
ncbi:uncharacterized protein PV06_04398 [Exophiala oligosperma]|uniref:Uncharacterized protein n=1 Tax=Exophiala oligosperma TaxID=215243 RepID=A0A0D2E636_9EURO|nr:uncharacterized protein PV06_04398 [Exophiala oligosperma]KIW43279.1 hypothetical protein PV06_04398 [Exophiala oligosperma]